jgi:hypothetical protein
MLLLSIYLFARQHNFSAGTRCSERLCHPGTQLLDALLLGDWHAIEGDCCYGKDCLKRSARLQLARCQANMASVLVKEGLDEHHFVKSHHHVTTAGCIQSAT